MNKMAKKSSTKRTVDKWKKKQKFSLIAPKSFGNKILGTTFAEKPKLVIKRTITLPLSDLTGQRMKRHISVRFKVVDVQGQNAQTDIVGFRINPGYISRLIRRRSSKVDLTKKIDCAKGKANITVITVTARKARSAQKTAIRKIVSDLLKKLEGKSFEDLIQELLFGTFSTKVFKESKKIALIKRIEVLKADFVEGKE